MQLPSLKQSGNFLGTDRQMDRHNQLLYPCSASTRIKSNILTETVGIVTEFICNLEKV